MSEAYCSALAVFFKHPVVGQVKTRLVPPLSCQDAQTLAIAFIGDSTASCARVASFLHVEPVAMFDPPTSLAEVRALVDSRCRLMPQRSGDLASRMQGAFSDLWADGRKNVCLTGADIPTLPQRFVVAAFEALFQGVDVVIGPAADGGYYLIGLRHEQPELFRDIAWSTATVFASTMERVHSQGLRVHVLPQWYDVDDVVALNRLRAELLAINRPVEAENATRTRDWFLTHS